MKIAATYFDGEIFQHFGHTEYFKIYETDGKTVQNSEVVSAEGFGHGALAGFLKGRGVDALICGGIGGGAIAALSEAGIKVYAGASGSADDCVSALLAGTLQFSDTANCSHHAHGEHACGGHEEGGNCSSHGCKNH